MTRYAPILILLALCGSACAQTVDVTGVADVSALVARIKECEQRIKSLETKPANPNVCDPIVDLGCVRISEDPKTYSLETAKANDEKLAKWFDDSYPGGQVHQMEWTGFFAITQPFGIKSDAGRTLPPQFSIETFGGWVNGYYAVTDTKFNRGASGLVQLNPKEPAIRCCHYGNNIECNLIGYAHCSRPVKQYPGLPRAKAAIEFLKLTNGPVDGRATVRVTAVGFERIFNVLGTNHGDHVHVEHLNGQDSLIGIYSECPQCVGWTTDHWSWFTPQDSQSWLAWFKAGGDCSFTSGRAAGDFGFGVVRLPDHPTDAANVGRYSFPFVTIDRAIPRATMQGKGELILALAPTNSPLWLLMQGGIANSGVDGPFNKSGKPLWNIPQGEGQVIESRMDGGAK